MKRCKSLISLIIISIFLAGANPSAPASAEEHDERGRAEEMAREAIEQLMRALELMIQSIPQYEMPEINEDGDIIIRRKRRAPREGPSEPGVPEIEKTSI